MLSSVEVLLGVLEMRSLKQPGAMCAIAALAFVSCIFGLILIVNKVDCGFEWIAHRNYSVSVLKLAIKDTAVVDDIPKDTVNSVPDSVKSINEVFRLGLFTFNPC